MQHFALRLGRQAVAVVDGVQIANPDGFVQDAPMAKAERLTVTIDMMELLRHRTVIGKRPVGATLRRGSVMPDVGAWTASRRRWSRTAR